MIEQLRGLATLMASQCKAHKALCPMDLAVATLVGMIVAVVVPPPTIAALPITACLVASVLIYRRACLLRRLEDRLNAPDGGPVHRVFVNNIAVGMIDDADLARIETRVQTELGTQVAVVQDVMRLLVARPLLVMVNSAPAVCFWMVVGALVMAPDELLQALTALRVLSPDRAAAAAVTFVQVLLSASVVVVAWQMATGAGRDLFDHAERRVHKLVRLGLGCAADGDVVLRRTDSASEDELSLRIEGGVR